MKMEDLKTIFYSRWIGLLGKVFFFAAVGCSPGRFDGEVIEVQF
jgi:hypothetical protein